MQNQVEMAGAPFGRGMAAIIMTFFGFVWLAWGLSTTATASNFSTALWVAFLVATVVLFAFAVATLRRGKSLMKAQGTSRREFWSQRGKAFRIVTIFEVLSIIIAIVLANKFHRPDLIAVGISFVVGLHFIPLGRVFDSPAYYAVGSLIAVWDIVSIAVAKPSGSGPFAAVGTGVILWTTAIAVLVRSVRLARGVNVS